MRRRVVLGVMSLVTAWSVWSFAQGHHPAPPPGPGPGHEAHAPLAHEGSHEGAHAAEHEEHGAPAAINWTEFGGKTPPFVALLVNFGILAAGYYLLGKKPIAEALVRRRDTIQKEIEEATRMRHEAEARAKTYQARLDTLEAEIQTARDALVRAGEAERERIVTEAEAKADRMRRDVEFLVEQEIKQIRVDLQRDTVEAAVAAAEELLRRRVTQADQERLAEDYLADLSSSQRAAAPGVSS